MDKLFPPVVRGVGIAIIGLNLASAAINNIQANGITHFTPAYYWSWGIALFVCLTAIILSSYGKGMVKMSSIVIALAAGYLLTLVLVKTGAAPETLMNLQAVSSHNWLEVPKFVLPEFDLKAIGMIAPIAIVTCVEHVGDVYANGSVVGQGLYEKFPACTAPCWATVWPPWWRAASAVRPTPPIPRTRRCWPPRATIIPLPCGWRPASPILVSFLGKVIGVVETVPNCVLGGACIVLYGMISSVGLRTLVENKVDFTKNRNLCIAAVMLVLAIGGAVIGGPAFQLSGIGLGILAGILLNLILPAPKAQGPGPGGPRRQRRWRDRKPRRGASAGRIRRNIKGIPRLRPGDSFLQEGPHRLSP